MIGSIFSLVMGAWGAYIVGSIPTGYWFARLFFNIDITQHGSGNIGATNIGRILNNYRFFFLIMFLDASKAAAYLLWSKKYLIISESLTSQLYILLLFATCLLLGNKFSLFLSLKGGKGVATSLGVLIALTPWWVPIFFIFSWLFTLVLFKRSYLAALVAIVCTTGGYLRFSHPAHYPIVGLLSALVIWFFICHIPNIKQEFNAP